MANQTLLAKARKARFDDLPNFSGHPSEDVERFLKSVKNITKANDESDNHELLEIIRGKLTQSAGLWLDNNEHNFKKWSDFETQFRNQYFSTTIIHKKFDQLKQRKQLHDEPVTSYIDDVINLCREIEPTMSDSIIIQHLMSGINPEFRKEISRHESCLHTLNEFLKYAKIEQDLYDTFEKTRQISIETPQPIFTINHTQTPQSEYMIKQPKIHQFMEQNKSSTRTFPPQRSAITRNSNYQPNFQFKNMFQNPDCMNSQAELLKNRYSNDQSTFQPRLYPCKICGRTNHRTNDCYYKRTTGCSYCGQNHHVRDCTFRPNFQ
ncbi:unnamed protein product [Rotaria sp. Silwood2]|nr:unnamed protein product [Rotaria sp. Silwood2]